MKKSKLFLGVCAIASMTALVSCGKKKDSDSKKDDDSSEVQETKYKVNYNANYTGAAAITSLETTAANLKNATLATPTRAGYTFDGWYTEAACTTKFDKATATLSADITLYAKWTEAKYVLAFDANYAGAADITPKEVTNASLADLELPTPTRENYTFAGWYIDADYSAAFDKATAALTEDTTIFAKWNVITYDVTFNTKINESLNGSAIAGKKYNSGSVLSDLASFIPTDSTGEYKFVGWYTDSTLETAATVTTKITANTTLYAKWDTTYEEISTPADFVKWVKGESLVADVANKPSCKLKADLDFTGITFDIPVSEADTSKTSARSLDGFIDGCGFKISKMDLTVAMKSGLFNKLKDGSYIQNITFENCTMNSTTAGSTFFANGVDAGCNVTFKSITMFDCAVASDHKDGQISAFVSQVKGNVTFDDIVIAETWLTGTKYSGILVAQVREDAQVIIKNSLIVGEVISESATAEVDAQGMGLLIGQENSTSASITFENVVVAGYVAGAKNLGYLIGDNKTPASTVTIKNVLVLGGEISGLETNTKTPFNTLIGQNKSETTTITDAYYIASGVKVEKTFVDANDNQFTVIPDELQGTPIERDDLTADFIAKFPNVTFDFENDMVTSRGVDILEIEPQFTRVERDYSTSITGDMNSFNSNLSLDAATYTATYDGIIPYASSDDGAFGEGNYVCVEIGKPDSLDAAAINDGYALFEFGGVKYKMPITSDYPAVYCMLKVTPDDFLDENSAPCDFTKTIDVYWTNDSIAQTYTLVVKNTSTFMAAPTPGAITSNSENTTSQPALVVAVNADNAAQLDLSGTVAYLNDGTSLAGNPIFLDVARPTWATGTDAPEITGSGAKMITSDDYTAGASLEIDLCGKAGIIELNVDWGIEGYDPSVYKINIGDTVITADPTPVTGVVEMRFNTLDTTTMTFDTSSKLSVAAEIAKSGDVPAYTLLPGIKVEPTQGSKTTDDSNETTTYTSTIDMTGALNTQGSVELEKKGFTITFAQACTVKVYFAGSGSNTGRYVKIIGGSADNSTFAVTGIVDITGKASEIVTEDFELTAGTYVIGGTGGIRIFGIDITY